MLAAPIALVAALLVVPAAKKSAPPRTTAPRSVVVLVDESQVPPAAFGPVTAAVRAEVDRSRAFAWKDPPPISWDELLLALNCKKADLPCLVKMGDLLKTESVLLVSVEGKGQRRELVLTMVQFKPERLVRKAGAPWRGVEAPQDAAKAARTLLGPVKSAILVVESQPTGARVILDGKPAGVTPLRLQDVAEGDHKLELTLDRHVPQSVQIVARAGELQEARFTLNPSAAEPAPKPAPTTVIASQVDPAVAVPERVPASPPPAAKTPAPWVAPVKWAMVGLGAAGSGLGALALVLGAAILAGTGGMYAAAFQVQALVGPTRMLTYPLSAGGGAVVALAVLLAPVAVGLIVGGFVLGAVL